MNGATTATNPPHYMNSSYENPGNLNGQPTLAQKLSSTVKQYQQPPPASAMYTGGPVLPLHAITEAPASVDCPRCNQRTVTETQYKSGIVTQ